jgi:cytochrome P450
MLPFPAYSDVAALTSMVLFCVAFHLLQSFRSSRNELARVPGPWLNAATNLPFLYAIWCGREADYVNRLHQEYGPIVRVAPDTVTVIGDAETWRRVHGHGSKDQLPFDKDMVFFISPVAAPTQSPGPITAKGEYHSTVRKVLAPAFGDSTIGKYEPRMKEWAALLCEVMAEKMSSDHVVDMIKLFNCKSFRVVWAHL